MEKQLTLITAVILSAGMIWMTGCKKDDTSPPSITLSGNSSITISLQGTYTEPGFTATDDEDGDLTASVTSDMSSTNPNKNLAGPYTITYTVSDAAGNTGTATRTVNVVNDADYLAGTYATKDSVYNPSISVTSYFETMTASITVNNRLWLTKFGNYLNGTVAIDRVNNNAIILPDIPATGSGQTVICGTPSISRIFTNTSSLGGTITTGATIIVKLDYKETVITPFSTANAISTWVKQ